MNCKKLALVLALSMTLLAGCGGSGSSAPATSPASPPASSSPAETPPAPADVTPSDHTVSGSFLMGTASATGNYYSFGSVLAQVINTATGSNITISATGGSVENIRLLSNGEMELALVQADANSYALTGTEHFAESGVIDNFQAITACYPDVVQIVVSKDSGIKSVADMKDKRICVGATGSGYEVAARQILAAYDMDYDDIDERFLSQSEGKNALQDGQIDGFFMSSGYPNSNVTELSLNGNIEVLNIDEEHMKKLLDLYPFYTEFFAEKDEYNLGYLPVTVGTPAILVASKDVSEDDVYAMTKAIYDNLDEIKAINAKGNFMSLEGAFRGVSGNVHPGAARYYEEQGLTVPGK